MSEFSELIKTFSRTRGYVRDFFIYGCKVRSEFTQKSSRSYDDERRRVNNWLSNYIQFDDSQRGRQIMISVDSGHILENPLYQAHYARSFTDKFNLLHFLLLDLLANGKSFTAPELTGKLNSQYSVCLDEKTVRNKLNEYVSEGLLIAEKQGKSVYFRLSPDTFSGFSKQYPGLLDAVFFFSEVQPFGVIGNSILQGERLHNDCFIMKHNYIVHTLDDEVLLTILEAIHAKQFLKITTVSIKSALSGEQNSHELICIPLRISTSVQTGRRYLIAYLPDYQRFNAHRLDHISDAKPAGNCPEYDTIMEKLHEELPHVFGVSFGNQKAERKAEPLRITLRIPPEEAYVLRRLQREKRCGTLEQTGEDTYCVTLDILDPREALPWIRTFICRIVSLEGGTEELRTLFREDLLAMAELYEEAEYETVS